MALRPGPVDFGPNEPWYPQHLKPAFERTEAAPLAEIDAIDARLVTLARDLTDVSLEAPYVLGDPAAPELIAALASLSDPADLEPLDGLELLAADIDGLVIEATARVPQDVWNPPPGPYIPPPQGDGFTDETPAGVDQQLPVDAWPPPWFRVVPAVRILNLDRSRADQFRVGERWLAQAAGPPNAPVTIRTIVNGIEIHPATVGPTDAQGLFALRGQMTAFEIGSWVEIWYLAGIEAVPVLSFEVLP